MTASQQIHTATRKTCGVLGCTGSVGQRFILLLSSHPYFDLIAVGASSRSAGKPYKTATRWKQVSAMPPKVFDLEVKECIPEHFMDCDIVFSGLDHDVAGDIEMAFLKANIPIFSNAKNYRRDPLTPLIVPTVNTSHFSIIPHQKSVHKLEKGFIITNANCSTTGIVVPLAALVQAFGPIEQCAVTTLQAISGGGYPGVPSMDIIDNVVPYIGGEEEKIEWETNKILGSVNASNDAFEMVEGMTISAQCNRVAVIDGHTACVMVKFAKRPPPSVEQIKQAMREYRCEAQELGCPSAPKFAIDVREEDDRPQPRLDRETEGGYAVSVGRIRTDPIMDIKFVALSHNTVIGAAGSSILNAEVAVIKGFL